MKVYVNNTIERRLMRLAGPWLGELGRRVEFFIRCRLHKAEYKAFIVERMQTRPFPLFDFIEIETINRCNGVCGFCPVSRQNDIRPLRLMSEEMFRSIIRQLRALNYSGHITLHSNNEPLLDKRMVRFCEHVRRELPNAFFVLYTNGILLTPEIFEELAGSLTQLVIDNYVSDDSYVNLIKPVRELYDRFRHDKRYDNVLVQVRDVNEVFYSRGGRSPNRRRLAVSTDCPCTLPYRQMVIRPDGKTSLWCCDALGEITLGDVKEMSLVEIWNNDRSVKVRTEMLRGRADLKLCRSCDAVEVGNVKRPASEWPDCSPPGVNQFT
ncbi:MAG: hypothetical protein A2285_04135 [Elusimicrobia bacterium RIFOXYA12_FULL_57_11]|nr:MAG: hypothetical protein A2285_04135 [Elusimicrobia bacterium RIFOXYA12_FULL_57_11]